MGHRDAAIDAQAFDLIEHGVVRWVRRIATKHAAWRNHAHRSATPLHRVNLYRGGLRAQGESIRCIKSVLRSPRRMSWRDIECVKVVEVGFDLAIVFDCI